MDRLASWPPGSVKLIFCWAHVWRKFFDFHCATASPTVSEALRRTLPSTADRSIARSHPPAGEVARWPLVDTMKTWPDAGPGASRSNPLARAICSAPRHWIRASLKTGVLKSLRTPLSAVASVIHTAKLNEIEPLAHRRDLLKRIVSTRTKASELRFIVHLRRRIRGRFY